MGGTTVWAEAECGARLAQADRVVVLFHGAWCAASRAFVPAFERADVESSLPFARVDLRRTLDARWDERRILVVPTVVYYEHGEELERVAAPRGGRMDAQAFSHFLDDVEALQESWRYRRGRLQVDRSG